MVPRVGEGEKLQLSTAQEMVLSSTPDDWELWEKTNWTDGGHLWLATFRADVALQLQWGRVVNAEYREPWTSNFPNPIASAIEAEADYAGSKVMEEILVTADGARNILPLGRVSPPDPASDAIEVRAGGTNLAVARLIHGLWGGTPAEFDAAVAVAGFIID